MAEPARRARFPHRSRALAAVIAMALAAASSVAAAAPRSQTEPRPLAGEIRLRSQTSWRLPDQPYSLDLMIESPAADALEVAVAVHRRVSSRSEFTQTIQGRLQGRPILEAPVARVVDLESTEGGGRRIEFTPDIAREGVYPVRVELRAVGGGRTVASLITHLLNVPPAVEGDELAVAWLVPVHAVPAVQPDGRGAIDDDRAELLAALARSLERRPEVDVTLAPTPETIEALGTSARDEDRATIAALARAAASRQTIAGSYVSTNLPGFLEGGLREEAAAQVRRGSATLARFLGGSPTTTTRVADERLAQETIAFLQSQQVDRLVVPEEFLAPISRNTTLAQPFELEGSGRIAAAMADAGAAAHFSTADPVLGAHQLLADLAVVYFDSPGTRRGVVVAPPRPWEPTESFVNALLGGLASSPVLNGVTVGELFEKVPPATTDGRTLLRRPAAAPTVVTLPAAGIRRARSQVAAFASAVEPDNPVLDRLDKTILVAASTDLRGRDRTAYVAGVGDQIRAEVERITMPERRSITLTAREAAVPVTVTSRLAYPVRAVLEVESEALNFPAGSSIDLSLERQNTTSQIQVEARGSGSFPLRVRLVSPDRNLVLAESRVTVRSTAISGVGTALSIGAGLFLVVWWANHFRARRSRRLVQA